MPRQPNTQYVEFVKQAAKKILDPNTKFEPTKTDPKTVVIVKRR